MIDDEYIELDHITLPQGSYFTIKDYFIQDQSDVRGYFQIMNRNIGGTYDNYYIISFSNERNTSESDTGHSSKMNYYPYFDHIYWSGMGIGTIKNQYSLYQRGERISINDYINSQYFWCPSWNQDYTIIGNGYDIRLHGKWEFDYDGGGEYEYQLIPSYNFKSKKYGMYDTNHKVFYSSETNMKFIY